MPDDLVGRYLDCLRRGEPDAMLSLFTDDAIVHSPLYGTLPAAQFYPRLFSDTQQSTLHLRRTFRDGESSIAFWFDFDWVLGDGTPAPFSVVDVAELDPSGRISTLHIVYDTVGIRDAFRAATGHESTGI
ncbi:nuclear transport factor 2 family protein [Williamsia serinedens]|uniref:Ketosteroid isomerase-related protein n=1 Tax=Williamsia serinedens TaxID=391736 RepID=A0ABT1GYW6_9NOCA|nr:nuclear transport factor 2 family protein [Williamsia serinedens]MCP2160066.1 Ketosteroid isomerase-related protein [Williamsia serinedens]